MDRAHGFTGILPTVAVAAFLVSAASTAGQAQVGSHQKISDTEGDFTGELDDGDEFGPLVGLGDLDGDTVEDMAVGAGMDDDGGPNRGAAWILFLNEDGTVKGHQKISDTDGNFTGALDDGDWFGFNVGQIGDLDSDGVVDIAVGAILDDDGAAAAGAAWILFLNNNGTVKGHQKISNTAGGFPDTLEVNDNFGFDFAPLGDLDGDTVLDLAVSAAWADDGGTNRGAVWVLFLNDDGTVKDQQKISDTHGDFTGILRNGDTFGQGLTSLGDLDGDDVVDLAVGAPNDGVNGHGAVWVLFMNTDGTVKSHQKINRNQGNFTGVLDPADGFGVQLAGVGDLNADGIVDLAVASFNDDDGGLDRGAVWLLFLNANGTVKFHQKISDTEGNFNGKLDDGDRFGISPNPLGDLDDDGVLDLAVGAYHDDDGGSNRGAVYVLFLSEIAVGVEDLEAASRPALRSHLVASGPNPFDLRTRIHYNLAEAGEAAVRVFDIGGRLVRSFDLSDRPAGAGAVVWDGRDDRGLTVASGSYLVRLVTSDSRDAMQVTLVK